MKKSRRHSPKVVLHLPDLEHAKSAVLNSLASLESRRSYDFAIQNFVHWYCSEPRLALNRIVVTRCRMQLEQLHLAPSTINQRLAAVRRLAYEASNAGLLSPELAAGIRRVRGVKQVGARLGNWLTAEQGRALVDAPPIQTLRGSRGPVGCGPEQAEMLQGLRIITSELVGTGTAIRALSNLHPISVTALQNTPIGHIQNHFLLPPPPEISTPLSSYK
jgi:hypothetical protein